MVFVFVLMAFVLIQANLAYRLSGQDESLIILREELAMLGDLLSLEREAGAVLSADLARTQAQLEMAENQNSLLTAQLSSLTAQLTDEKTKTTTLENTLATERLRLTTELTTLSAQTAEQARELEQMSKSLDQKTQSLKQAATDLSAEQKQSEQARLEIDRLTAAMQSLRSELTRLRTLLSEKQEQSKKDKIAIANLGKELNAALANKVQELQRFRSEFFGRLRTILEGRSDVKVVGTALSSSQKFYLHPDKPASTLKARLSLARSLMLSCRLLPTFHLTFPGSSRLRAIQTIFPYPGSTQTIGIYPRNGHCPLSALWLIGVSHQSDWLQPAMVNSSQSPLANLMLTVRKTAA